MYELAVAAIPIAGFFAWNVVKEGGKYLLETAPSGIVESYSDKVFSRVLDDIVSRFKSENTPENHELVKAFRRACINGMQAVCARRKMVIGADTSRPIVSQPKEIIYGDIPKSLFAKGENQWLAEAEAYLDEQINELNNNKTWLIEPKSETYLQFLISKNGLNNSARADEYSSTLTIYALEELNAQIGTPPDEFVSEMKNDWIKLLGEFFQQAIAANQLLANKFQNQTLSEMALSMLRLDAKQDEILAKQDETLELVRKIAGIKPQRVKVDDIVGEELEVLLPAVFVGEEHKKKLEELKKAVFESNLPIVVVSAPEGFGKTTIVQRLINDVSSGDKITVPSLEGIIRLSSRYYQTDDVFSLIVDFIDEFSSLTGKINSRKNLREIFDQNINREAGRIPPQGKCQIVAKRLYDLGKIWLVIDGCEKWLSGNAQSEQPESHDKSEKSNLRMLLAAIESRSSLNKERQLKVIITTAANQLGLPELSQNQIINITRRFDEQEAIECLKGMAQEEGLSWRVPDGESERLLARLVKNEDIRIPRILFGFIEFFKTKSKRRGYDLQNAVAEAKEVIKEKHDNYIPFLNKQFDALSTESQLVWLALAVFRKPISFDDLASILSKNEPKVVANVIKETLHESSWIIESDSDETQTYVLEELAKEFVFKKMEDANSLTNYLSFIRYYFHREAAKVYKKAKKGNPENFQDLDAHLEEIYHLTQSEQYGTAAYRLSEIDLKYLIKFGYPNTLINYRLKLSKSGEELSTENIKSQSAKAQHLNSLGVAYGKIGDKKRAERCIEASLGVFQEIKMEISKAEGRALSDLAEAVSGEGEKGKALKLYEDALSVQKVNKDEKFIGRTLLNIGLVYGEMGKLEKALERYEEALRSQNNNPNKTVEGRISLNIGIVHVDLGDFTQAREYFDKALIIHNNYKDRIYVGRTKGNLAELLLLEACVKKRNRQITDYEKLLAEAEKLFAEAIATAQETFDKDSERRRILRQGILYYELEDYDRSQQNYNKVLEINNPLGNCRAYLLLGILNLHLKNSSAAQANFKLCLNICKSLQEKTPEYYVPHFCSFIALLGSGDAETAKASAKINIDQLPAKGILRRCFQYLEFMQKADSTLPGLDYIMKLMKDKHADL